MINVFVVGKIRVFGNNNLYAPWRCNMLNNIIFHETSDLFLDKCSI